MQVLLFLLVLLSGRFQEVYSQCTLTVQDVNYCNTNSAVLGVGMQLTLASVPISNTITDFSWTGPNGFTSNSQYPILPSPVVPGNYTLTVQAPGCVTDASDITINLSTTSSNCPIAAFTASPAVVCDGATTTFTNQTAGGGNSYLWLFGDGTTSTSANPTHVYNVPEGTGTITFTATLVVTNAAGLMDIVQQVITVRQIPAEPIISSGQLQPYNGQEYLVQCTDEATGDIFLSGVVSSAGSWIQSYTINWGDGSPAFNFTTFPVPCFHTYNRGLYTFQITLNGPNGCSISNTYPVFVGNTPAGSLGSLGNTEQCTPYTFNFPINDVGNNPAGTTYTVIFSDGGATQTFNHPPPAFVSHTFTESSCGQTTPPPLSYPDAFWVQISAQNPCETTINTIQPIRISTPPIANFTLPSPVCINNLVSVNSTADPGTNVNSSGCNNLHGMVWSISPPTGWVLTSGTLGSINGQTTNYLNWTTGSNQLGLTFSTPGNYTITQRIRNSCGEDVETKTVCVVPPLTASFTLSGAPCAPSVLSATPALFNTCVPPVYLWSIFPGAPFDVNVPPFTANSIQPEWLLTQEGTYTVNLSVTNACGISTATNNFTIVAPPDVNLSAPPPGCLSAPYSFDPSVTYDDGGGTITLQQWQINGGAWQTITPAEPVDFPPQVFNAGTHTIKVRITNECGTDSSLVTFTVSNPPAITVSDFAVCSGLAEIINNGSPTVNPATGAQPITYMWSGSGLSNNAISNPSITLNGVGSQIISLTATDALGCTSIDNINVNINPLPTLSPVPNAMCFGSTAVPLSVSSNISGTSFSWSPSTGLSATSGDIVFANPPDTTTYTITGTDALTSCSSSASVVLTVNPLPVVNTAPILQVCAQAIPIELNQGIPAGGVWTDPTPASGSLSQVGGIYFYTPPTIPGNDNLTYTYTDPNGCVNSDNMPVQILPVDPAVAGPNFSVCNNAPLITLSTGSPTGGVWSGSGVLLTGNSFQLNPASVASGAYWLFYTINANTNCEFTDSLLVTVYPVPTVNPLSDSICSGAPITLTPNVSGGNAPLSYVWAPNTGLQGPSNQPSATFIHDQSAPNDAVYNYTLTVTDVYNCSASNNISLTVNPLPLVDVVDLTSSLCTQPISFQMNVTVTAIGGSGLWTGSNISGSGLFTPPSTTGSQWVYHIYNDANGCVNEDSTLINLIVPVIPDAGLPLNFCLNAPNLILTPTTNLGGIWTGPGVNTGIFNPNLAGVGMHNLKYTINQGTTCETKDSIDVEVFPIPQVESLSDSVCSGLTIVLEPDVIGGTQPYSYQWSPTVGVLGNSNQSIISVLHIQPAPNDTDYTYSLTVTDTNNCVVVVPQNLTVNPLPVVFAGPDSILCNQSISYPLQGFSPTSGPSGTGVWSGSPNLLGSNFSPNGTGTVQLTYTFTDNNGCINSDGVALTINDPQFPDAGDDFGICNNAATVQLQPVSFPGGIWTGPGVNAGIFNPNLAGVGMHNLKYTINQGTTCETKDSIDVEVFPIPQVESLSDSECSGLTIVLEPDIIGGTQPYSYQWSPTVGILGNLNQSSISVLHIQPAPNDTDYTYSLTVTDSNNCVVVVPQNLTVNPLPVVYIGPDLSTCFSPGIPFQITNTISPPGGAWFNFPGNVGSLNGLNFQTGGVGLDSLSYSYIDNNGCSNADTLVIDVVSPISVEVGPQMALCETDAFFDLPMPLPLNPPANYTATWIGNGVELINGIYRFNPALAAAGINTLNYSFQEVGNTCAAGDQLQIFIGTVPQLILPDVSICSGLDTTLTVTLVNGSGTAPFTYQWNPNPALSLPLNSASSVYSAPNIIDFAQNDLLTVTITDGVGCVGSLGSVVTINPLPVVNAGLNDTICNQPIAYTLSGYSPPAGPGETGIWSGSPNLSGNVYTPTGLANGSGNQTLTYTFTDLNGCINSDQVVLSTVAPVFPDAGLNREFCFADASASLVPTTQPGGIWSGPGVSLVAGNYEFDPSDAGVGTHSIVYTIFDGTTCETQDILTYKVFPMPDVDAGNDQQMCSGDTISITGTGSFGTLSYQYAWTPITGILSGSATATASIQLLNNTSADISQSYTLTLTDSAGCIASDNIDITVHPLPYVNAGLDDTLCNQPIAHTLSGYSPTAGLGGTGIWSGSPNLSGDDVFTPNGLGSVNLTYTFTDDLNGCINSDQIVLTIVDPVFPDAGLDNKFCFADASVTLVPTSQPGGIWSGPGVSLVAGNYDFDPSDAGVGTHSIVYTIFDGTTCETYDTLVYKVFPMPDVDAGNDQQMCSGDTISITGAGSLGTLSYQYAWTPITGILSGSATATASIQLFNNTSDDIIESYSLTLTDSAGCIASDIIDITVHPLPDVNAGLDDTLCNQPIVHTLSGYSPTAGPGEMGIWSGSPNLSGDEFTPNGLDTLNLIYTFTDTNGCINSDQVVLTIVDPLFPEAGPHIETCISDLPIILIPTTLPGGIWSGTGISQQGSDFLFSPSLAGEGVFTINYTVFTGTTCETKDSIDVTVFPLPQVKLGPDIDLCIDAPCYQITDFLPNNGNWIVPPTGLFFGQGSVSNSGVFCPQLNTPGDYKIYYQFTDPITTCINLDSMIIRVHPLPIPQFTIDPVICINAGFNPINTSIGDSIYGGGVVYQWRVIDYMNLEYASYTGSSPNISIADVGNYIIELTITTSAGCVNQFQRPVFIIDIPVPDFSLSANTGCAPVSIDITNLSTGDYPDYAWTVNGIYQDFTSTPLAITFPSPVLGDTTYIVNLNISNQCGARDYQEEFLARPTPVSIFSADTYIGCSPFVPVFTNSSYGSPDSYTWIFSDGFIYNGSLPVGHGFIAIDNDTTNYTVTLVTQNACGINSSTLNFVALPNTIVAFFNTIPQFGCAPLPVTMSNYSSGATNYLWNFDDGSAEVSTYNASHVFQEGGNYTVSLIATDGCSIDTAYSNITVFQRPTIDFIPDEDVICQGSVLGLTNLSQGAVAYLWDFGNNETSASFEPNYIYNTPGNYTVQLIGYSPVFGCPDTLSLPIEVRNIPQLNIEVDPMMGCMPLHVNFFNNTLYTSGMEWNFGNGLSSTSFNPSTNYYQFGEYPVNVIAHNYSFANNLDCPIDTQIVISVFPKPTSSFTLDSYASCGIEASVNVVNASQGGLSYLWKWQQQNSFEFEPIIAINDTGNIQIDLMVSNEFSCMDTTSNTYVLTAQPKAILGIDPPIGCEPLNVTFSALDVYGDAWIWNFGDGVSSQQGPDVFHEYENDGKYTLTLQVGNNNTCFDDTTITQAVVVNPRADAKFRLDKEYVSPDDPVIGFENQSTEATIFTLDVGDGAIYNNFVNQHFYQNVIDGEYEIQLIANNQYNCPDTANKILKVEPQAEIYIPNTFTPNGDGYNEFFGPEFIGDPKIFDFLVFDRWGHVIFETHDKNVKWNGTFKNQNKEPIKQDVYVYRIVIIFDDIKSFHDLTGTVTLIY